MSWSKKLITFAIFPRPWVAFEEERAAENYHDRLNRRPRLCHASSVLAGAAQSGRRLECPLDSPRI
jgi:hypothetical protein